MVLPVVGIPEGDDALAIEIEVNEMGFVQAFYQYSSIHEGKPKGIEMMKSIIRYLRSFGSRFI
jgi:hypothetical protein